jgi:hypothetical protein
MKNKSLIIFSAIGLVVLIIIGVFVFISGKKSAAPVVQTPPEEVVSAMKPEEIGLTLSASADHRKVILEVAKTVGISKLNYDLTYVKKGDIPVGVMGEPKVTEGQTVRQEVVLGTCSDVCHYDEDVSNIKLTLKVTKTDGTVSQVEKILELAE